MADFVPVDHQPEFDHSLHPVEYDPFAAEKFANPAVQGAITSLATLPQRAIQNSQFSLDTGTYDPSSPVEAALTVMGGGLGGTGKEAGAALGSGPIRDTALDMSTEARMARAADQGYTIDAYKGGQPYDWDTMPSYYGSGKVVPGTENRIPQELTSINSPNADYAGFFSHDPEVANRFAAPYESGAVWPAKLKFENPLVIDAEGKHAAAFQFESIAREPKNNTLDKMKAFKGAFEKDSPHDGVILKNTKDEGDVYVPRNPDQIRSRFAKFDPASKGSGLLLGSAAGVSLIPVNHDPFKGE